MDAPQANKRQVQEFKVQGIREKGKNKDNPAGQSPQRSAERAAGSYSLKRRGWAAAAAAAAAGFRRAMPTTPRTVTSASAARGTNMRSVEEFKSGGVICKPLSSKDRRSLGITPSNVSPSRKRNFTHKPSSFGRLKKALRCGSNSSENSRTK